MRVAVALFAAAALSAGGAPRAARAADDGAAALCRSNPAYSADVMRNVLEAQLEKDHDAALDAEPPAQMAAEAAEQGVQDCARELRASPPLYAVIAGVSGADLPVAWDAYNTACNDHAASKPACVKAEVGAVRALKRMVATNQPPGAKILVETCELMLQSDPAMADWRACVDTALAVHAKPDQAMHCKTSVPWHTARTGAEAGGVLAGCLKGGH